MYLRRIKKMTEQKLKQMTALDYLIEAQSVLNADGITKEVSEFLREFFAGLAYTEEASQVMLHNRDGGYFFCVSITEESVKIEWDVSKDGEWEDLDVECSMLFREHTAERILSRIESEFKTMTSKCFVIKPELKPAAN
jgi:hypothetical protein